MTRGRFLRDMSVATRLSIVALVVTLLSLAASAGIGLNRASDLADGLAEDLLVTSSASRADNIEGYVAVVGSEVQALAISPATADAIGRFSTARTELDASDISRAERDEISDYYIASVLPQLERARGAPVGLYYQLPSQPAALRLQSLYSLPSEDDEEGLSQPADPLIVVDAGDGSSYSAVHAELHPVYAQITRNSGFDDLMLIDADLDTIVYTAQKRIDFGTSLDVGPLSGSALAALINRLDSSNESTVDLVDFAAYAPAGDQPRMFVASSVFDDDGGLVGFVAVSLSTDPFDDIVSGGGNWESYGETGETYVVGADGLVRTTVRPFQESSSDFLAAPEEASPLALTDRQRERIRATGTTALVISVPPETLETSTAAETVEVLNYRGDEVTTAVRSVEIDRLDWSVFTDVATEELRQPIETYARNMLLAIAVFVVVVTFLAVRWSDRVVEPIRLIAARLRAVRHDAPDADRAEVVEVPESSPLEYLELAEHIDDLLARLRERQVAVDERAAERTRLLAGFLPTAAAERVRVGDDVIDHAENATVVVITLEGLGSLVEQSDTDTRGLLAATVEALDELVADFGLERAKVTGATYVAVCGVVRPALDHAPRAVGFGLAAAELVAEIGADEGVELSIHAGVETGSVSVGVARRSGLVYDAWGTAVADASRLARLSPAGAVAVSAKVSSQLPPDFQLANEGPDHVTVVTGRVSETAT